ncbi:MAG: peptide ABC transporter substrate-binding protein, partial [Gammaproteobacteria bacterium]
MTPIRRTCLVVLWLLVVACGTKDVGQSDSTLHRGLGTDPESLDAQKARSVQAANVLRDIGEGLLAYSADGQLVPAAAERWEIADDGLTYTFTIRADARWSNGDPLTAMHFVLGLRRLVNPANAAFYANTITDIVNAEAIISSDMSADELGVAAIDAQTLRIELTQPVPYLLSLLTHPSTFPAHSKLGNV